MKLQVDSGAELINDLLADNEADQLAIKIPGAASVFWYHSPYFRRVKSKGLFGSQSAARYFTVVTMQMINYYNWVVIGCASIVSSGQKC